MGKGEEIEQHRRVSERAEAGVEMKGAVRERMWVVTGRGDVGRGD